MTQRSAREVAAAWVAAGGPASRAAEWVAIAMGESSLNDAAVSPDGAIGVWQIMPFNAGPNGVTVADLYNIDKNAYVAVQMSGNGVNCAAWDSCYADIGRSGRYSYLAYPEKGSADYNNLAVAAVALGVDAVAAAVPEPDLGVGAAIGNLASGVQAAVNLVLPELYRNSAIEHQVVGKMYQPGWRAWMSGAR